VTSQKGIRAGAAYVELFADDSRLMRGLKRAEQRLKAFGSAIRSIGTRMAAIGSAVFVPMLGAVKVFASTGSALNDLSTRTGVSAETLSELGFAAEQSGTSLNSLGAALYRMSRRIANAATGSGPAVRALQDLGINAEWFAQLDAAAQFRMLADALNAVENPALAAQYAFEILGDNARELMPLIRQGSAGISKLEAEARALGLTISSETAEDAAILDNALKTLWRVLQQGVFLIGSTLAPLVMELTQRIARAAVMVNGWIKQNKVLIVTAFKVAAAVVAAGFALIAMGLLVSGLGAAIGVLASVLAGVGTAVALLAKLLFALLSPIGLVIAGVTALGSYLLYTSGVGGEALRWLAERFRALRETASKAIEGIAAALAAGDISLAAKILWLTLKMEWQRGVGALSSAWAGFKAFFVNIAHQMFYGALAAGEILWHGLEVAWIEATAFLSKAWTNFTSTFRSAWNTAVTWVEKRIHDLWGLLDRDYDAEAAKQLADQMLSIEKDAIERQRRQNLDQREQKRNRDRKRAAEQHEGTLGVIGEEYERAKERLDDEYGRKMRESEEALAEARREWEEAIAEALRKRGEIEAQEDRPSSPRRFLSGFDDQIEGILDALDRAAKRIEVKGTFNAAAVEGLGTGAQASVERTAKASEQTAKNTKRLVDMQRSGVGGAAFV
jgi:TP901 family phage tail tape measure protein